MIPSFFSALASRLPHENNLSDITWALCQASDFFREFFMKFFFPKEDFSVIDSMDREYPAENNGRSRADFLVRVRGSRMPYVIEVKIYDRNQHFEQYKSDYGISKDHLGYITNYYYKQDDYEIKTWTDLYYRLSVLVDSLTDETEKSLITGYLKYLQNTCGIKTFNRAMDFSNAICLYQFQCVVQKAIKKQTDQYILNAYPRLKNIEGDQGILGAYFYAHYNDGRLPETYIWTGIYFNREPVEVWTGIENRKGYGQEYCNIVRPNMAFNPILMKCSENPIYEEKALWFKLKPERLVEFQKLEKDEQQEQFFVEYLDEIIMLPYQFL